MIPDVRTPLRDARDKMKILEGILSATAFDIESNREGLLLLATEMKNNLYEIENALYPSINTDDE